MRRVFIVGAGASLAPPAGLPLFGRLREYLIGQVGLDEDLARAAEDLAPETFMRCLHEGDLPLEEWLTQTLRQGEPNAVHAVLAGALAGGDTVWTVNVDELIEKAAGANARVAAYDDDRPDASANLLKPHGTTSRGRYLFRSDQVVTPLPGPWQQRLLDDCAQAEVIAIGYRAMDIDLRAILDDALRGASTVTWFEARAEWDALRERLPALRQFPTALRGSDPANLSAEFLAWADQQRLTGNVTTAARAAVATRDDRPIATIGGDPRLARALLLERIGARRAARRQLLGLLTHPPRSRIVKAAKRLRTIDVYAGALWTKPILLWTGGPLRTTAPDKLRLRFDRAHVTILSSHLGQHRAALARAAKALNPDDSAIMIARAKSLRFTGGFDEAIAIAAAAERATRANKEIDELAHALYELVFTYTWMGRFADARTALSELFSGVDGLAGIRWVAWAHWHHAGHAIYANDPDTALRDLERAYALFGSDQLVAGQAATLNVRLTAARLKADDSLFRTTLTELTELRGSRGWTDYTEASLAQEQAEWHRQHDDLLSAAAFNDRVIELSGDQPVHLGIALLTRAELQRASGEDNSSTVADVERILSDFPMAYVAAHMAITDYLAGRTTSDAALRTVRRVAPDLGTRSGTLASDPLDYCLGRDAARHELFLP